MVAIRKKTPFRKSLRRTTKKRTSSALPARFPSGKKTYLQTRAVSRVLKNISETKIKELAPSYAKVPTAVEASGTTGPCYFVNYCLGTAPNGWNGPNGNPAFTNLEGFEWPLGPGAAERNGQYLYLKRTTVNLRIAMNQISRHGPTKFRVIVYKEKRNRYNTTANGNPCDDLFIDQSGAVRGVNNLAVVDARAMNFNTWLVNKRNYQVVRDTKFVLAPEQNSAQGSTDPFNVNQHNSAEKMIRLSLGHYQKARFGSANVPEDQMYRYCMTVISMPMSTSTSPHNDWRTYANGVVSCVDN